MDAIQARKLQLLHLEIKESDAPVNNELFHARMMVTAACGLGLSSIDIDMEEETAEELKKIGFAAIPIHSKNEGKTYYRIDWSNPVVTQQYASILSAKPKKQRIPQDECASLLEMIHGYASKTSLEAIYLPSLGADAQKYLQSLGFKVALTNQNDERISSYKIWW